MPLMEYFFKSKKKVLTSYSFLLSKKILRKQNYETHKVKLLALIKVFQH